MKICDFQIRPATVKDNPFLIETIIEAEKSGTDKIGLSNLFHLSEEKLRQCLIQMMEEEIDGCEFSISSFQIAEIEGISVAAIAGWIEGENEDNIPSGMLKSNLLGFVLPKESLEYVQKLSGLLGGIQIARETYTYQIEYVYVSPDYRGMGLISALLDAHSKLAGGVVHKMQVQAFANNSAAIKAYEKYGFKVKREYEVCDEQILNYLPYNIKLLLEKNLIE